jgi:hypothetical protein
MPNWLEETDEPSSLCCTLHVLKMRRAHVGNPAAPARLMFIMRSNKALDGPFVMMGCVGLHPFGAAVPNRFWCSVWNRSIERKKVALTDEVGLRCMVVELSYHVEFRI